MSAGDDDDEVGDRSRDDRDDDQQREVARVDQAREHTDHYQHNRAGSDPDHQRVPLPRQRVGHLGCVRRQVLAAEVYWMRPPAMPTAARPKPQWKPAFS